LLYGSESSSLCPNNEEDSQLFWYVAYTQPRREKIAANNLVAQGFATYLPLYRTFKKSRLDSLPCMEPMFPRYIFFKPKSGQSLSAARSTRGIAFVLSFGTNPATLKDKALQSIRHFELHRNLADINQLSPFQVSAKVRLSGEKLFGIEGLVTSVSTKRVTLLIELLGGYRKMSVEHNQIELI